MNRRREADDVQVMFPYMVRRLMRLCCVLALLLIIYMLLINITTNGLNKKWIYGNSITDGSDSDRYHLTNNQSLASGATFEQQEKKKYLEQRRITNKLNLPKIPHRIHQVWNNYNIHEIFVPWISSWFIKHPKWEYWWWTMEDAEKLIHKIPEVEDVYNQLTDLTQKANVIRYVVIYTFGGVYADIDMESLKPFDSWTEKYHCIMMDENLEHPLAYDVKTKRGKLMITMLPCRANHPYYKTLLKNLHKYPHQDVRTQHRFAGYTYEEFTSANHNVSSRDEEFTSSNHNASSRDGVYVEHDSKYFFPTFDPKLKRLLKTNCANKYSKLSETYKSICDRLKTSNFTNVPTNEAYTNHYWVHVNVKSQEYLQMKQFDIRNIVPAQQLVNVTKEIEILKEISL